jgi:hypothetical protein
MKVVAKHVSLVKAGTDSRNITRAANLQARVWKILCRAAFAALVPYTAKANLVGDQLDWGYYAYGGSYYGVGGNFSVSGSGFTTVSGTFTDIENSTYFNIVANPSSVTFDYSPDNKSNGTVNWSPSALSLPPTIHNGIAINLISGSPVRSVTVDPATNMPGFSSSNISFSGNQIQVDWQNLPFNSSTKVKLDVNTGQTVYLDLGANSNAKYNIDGLLSNTSVTYSKPAASLTAAQVSQVLSDVRSVYANYNVNFTTTQPTAGPYETIYVGGTASNISASNSSISINPNTLGISQAINVMDSNPNDTAVVFSGNPAFSGAGGADLLGQVIAHETGHLIGLQHVLPPTELMYPYASTSATGISSSSVPIALINSAGSVVPVTLGWTQNSAADLLCAVGSVSGSTSCANADSLKSLAVFTSGFSTIYNAKLIVLPLGGGNDDTGVTEENIGTIDPGVSEDLYFPEYAGEKVILDGASTPGGSTDIFAGLPSGLSGDPTNPETFAISLSDLGGLDYYEVNPDGSYTNLGSLVLSEPDAGSSVPEPSGWTIVLVGLGGLVCVSQRSRTRRSSLTLLSA